MTPRSTDVDQRRNDGDRPAATAGRPRGRPRNAPPRDVRREELLDAAITVVRRDGPAASMDSIAAAAGVTKGIFYSHFGDKAGMASAVAAHIARQLADEMTRVVRKATTFGEQVRGMVTTFVDFVDHDPELFEFLLHPPASKNHTANLRQLQDTLAMGLAPLIKDPVVGRGFPAESSVVFAYATIGLTYSPTHWWATSGRATVTKRQLIDQVSSMIVGALTIPPPA